MGAWRPPRISGDAPGRPHGGCGGRQIAGSMDPLRGRDAAGRMVQEPRRGQALAGATPAEAPRRSRGTSASVSSPGGGRGGGRRRGLHRDIERLWLSQAIPTVDLRSPLDRRVVAGAGERSAIDRRRRSRPARRENSTFATSLAGTATPLRFSCMESHKDRSCGPAPLVHIFSKAGGPEPAVLCLYIYYFVSSFVGGSAAGRLLAYQSRQSWSDEMKNIRQMPIVHPAFADTSSQKASGVCR